MYVRRQNDYKCSANPSAKDDEGKRKGAAAVGMGIGSLRFILRSFGERRVDYPVIDSKVERTTYKC